MFIMEGGNPALYSELFQINIFVDGSYEYEFLNPFNGIIFSINALHNYYHFGEDESNLYKLIIKLYRKINLDLRPSKIFEEISNEKMGEIIGYLYLNYLNNNNLEKKTQINKLKSSLFEKFKAFNYEFIEEIDNVYFKDKLIKIKNEYNEILQEIPLKHAKKSLIMDKFKKTLDDYFILQTNFIESSYITFTYNKDEKELIKLIKKYIIFLNESISDENKFKNREFFMVLLALVFWNSNDREGILNYYRGLQSVLGEEIVRIPDDFMTQNEKSETFDDLIVDHITKNNSELLSYDRAIYHGKEFPDCGETSLRNFFNLISYNNNSKSYDKGILELLGANEKLMSFYTNFDTIKKQFNGYTDKDGIFHEPRNEWAEVVSDLECVIYEKNNESKKYEIGSKFNDEKVHNILNVIRKITRIKDWEDFNKILSPILKNFKLTYEDSSTSNDNINIYITININLNKYEWFITEGHYDLSMINDLSDDSLLGIDAKNEFRQLIINTFTTDYSYINNHSSFINYYNINYDTLQFILNKYKPINKTIIKIINSCDEVILKDTSIRIKLNYDLYAELIENNPSKIDILFDIKRNDDGKIIELKLNTLSNKLHHTSLKKIVFGDEFNEKLNRDVFPPSLEEIIFGYNFNQELEVGMFPTSLKKIVFGDKFNEKLKRDVFPPSLEEIIFGYNFNQELEVGMFPTSLKKIVFGDEFNEKLKRDVFPPSLEEIIFGHNFNQELEVGMFPTSLKKIVFGYNFNQELEVGVFPSSLEEIIFGYNFNQELEVGMFPTSLKKIVFGDKFNEKLKRDVFPPSLEEIIFGYNFNQELEVGVFPSSLEEIIFGNGFNQQIEIGLFSDTSLKKLVFGDNFNKELKVSVFPSSLEEIIFGDNFDQQMEIGLFSDTSLKKLVFGYNFNKELKVGVFPSSLEEIIFGDKFNQKIETELFSHTSLKKIVFGFYFNKELKVSVFPSSLEEIIFGYYLNDLDLPISLKKINITLDKYIYNEDIIKLFNDTINKLINLELLTLNGTHPLMEKIHDYIKKNFKIKNITTNRMDIIYELEHLSKSHIVLDGGSPYQHIYEKLKYKYIELSSFI
jgi:hypothetical protein